MIQNEKKSVKLSKSVLAQNRAFRIAKCRLGEPIVGIELSDDMLKNLLQVAKEEWDLIWLSLGRRPAKTNETFKRIWVERYFDALCLETLSRIRGKFSGTLPIPDKEIQFNSENLRIDANNAIQSLRNMLYEAIVLKTKKND